MLSPLGFCLLNTMVDRQYMGSKTILFLYNSLHVMLTCSLSPTVVHVVKLNK